MKIIIHHNPSGNEQAIYIKGRPLVFHKCGFDMQLIIDEANTSTGNVFVRWRCPACLETEPVVIVRGMLAV